MDYSNIIKKIKSSIALIAVFNKNKDLVGTGSGFIFHKKGILVTCNHVVKDGANFLLKFSGEDKFISGKVVIQDDEHDLALIRFEDNAREPLVIGNINEVMEGMPVVFSGYPFNSEELTTHQGILSAIGKDSIGSIVYFIDGTVNSGNSGCPLMNSDGKVIGIVSASRIQKKDLLEKVQDMTFGAISLYSVDLIELFQALSSNLQLGMGAAIPASYIPEHKELDNIQENI